MATANFSSEEPEQSSQTISEKNNQTEFRQPPEVFIREIVETLLLTFFIFWLVHSLVGRYRIDGSSMNPTLLDGEYLIINNVTYLLDDPQYGDIVVFRDEIKTFRANVDIDDLLDVFTAHYADRGIVAGKIDDDPAEALE